MLVLQTFTNLKPIFNFIKPHFFAPLKCRYFKPFYEWFLSTSFIFQSSSNAKVEQEIIKWVNDKLVESGKPESKINSFQDSKIATARPIIDLIDAIKPGVINYELLQENGGTYEVSSVFLRVS